MDNQWPPMENCPQYGILQPYLRKFKWEDVEDDDTHIEISYDDSEDEADKKVSPRRFEYKYSSLKKFVEQVRTTRGYDVDDGLPSFMFSPFLRADLTDDDDDDYVYLKKWVDFAIETTIKHIRSKTGKFYEHVKTLNVTEASRFGHFFLTFTAVEVANEKTEECQKKVADAAEETFLATVFTRTPAWRDSYEVFECILKPQGPAPWKYEKRPSLEHHAP